MFAYIAVACGSSLYYFYRYKKYFQFDMPEKKVNDQEIQIWKQLTTNQIDVNSACEKLHNMRESGVEICCQSVELLAIES